MSASKNGAPRAGAPRPGRRYPLDIESPWYSYFERPNPAIQALYGKHVAAHIPVPRVLDIGCGCGANDRGFKKLTPHARIVGIEPHARAAELASRTCDEVFHGELQDWLKSGSRETFDVVILSDVLEHIADPIAFLRELAATPSVQDALWIVSVPNYGVWYNRFRTLLGLQDYAWSGIWDRTHLRFFTRRSIKEVLDYCGFELVDESSTPSLVQSTAPLIRRAFERELAAEQHLALVDSKAFALYQKAFEPLESVVCDLWPELLALQIVHVARLRR